MLEFDGDRLIAGRKRLGLTQKDLGERIGLEGPSAERMVSSWERGVRTPHINTLPKLAHALDCGLRDLFTDRVRVVGDPPTALSA